MSEIRNPVSGDLRDSGDTGAADIDRELAAARAAYIDLRRNWGGLTAAQKLEAVRRGQLAILSLLDGVYA